MGYFLDYLDLTLLERGVYTLAGIQVVLDDLDLARMADDYNKLKPPRIAPIVVGHPENDAPIYGAVDSLTARDNKLIARVNITSESFRQLHKGGAYARYEAQFFAPDNPANPKPGTWLLKHVGFIGPAPNIRGVFMPPAAPA